MNASLLKSLAGLVLAALMGSAVPAVAVANGTMAVPELIAISEAESETETGAALVRAQASLRENLGIDNAAALVHAKEVVALAVRLWGDSDPRVAQALTNLAIAQAQTGEYALARDNFRSALRVHEVASNSIVSPALINPLRGLASANVSLNEIARAVPHFERAIHISHVNSGPNNLDQIADMAELSRAHYFLQDIERATAIQNNLFRLQQRRFSPSSDQYIDALLERARWYARVQNFDEAKRNYKRVERLLVEHNGPDDIRLIEPLIEMAFTAPGERDKQASFNSIDQEIALINDGMRAINRAVRVARANGEQNPQLLSRTLARAGDWMVFSDNPRKALQAYREAWELAEQDPAMHEWRDNTFSQPTVIVQNPIRTVQPRNFKDTANVATLLPDRGFIELSFSVNKLGRPVDVFVTNSEPPGLMEAHVIRSVKRFLYRPAIRDGRPVVTEGMTFRHDYRYNRERLSGRERERIARVTEIRANNAAKQSNETPSTEQL